MRRLSAAFGFGGAPKKDEKQDPHDRRNRGGGKDGADNDDKHIETYRCKVVDFSDGLKTFALEGFKEKDVILCLDRFEAAIFADSAKRAADQALIRWGFQQLRTVKWNYEKKTFEFGGVLPNVAEAGELSRVRKKKGGKGMGAGTSYARTLCKGGPILPTLPSLLTLICCMYID